MAVYCAWPKLILCVYLKPFESADEMEELSRKVAALSDETRYEKIEQLGLDYFRGVVLTLKDLLVEEREKILSRILREKFEKLSQSYQLIFKEFLPILEEFHKFGQDLPHEIKGEVEFVLRQELLTWLTRFDSEKDLALLKAAEPLLSQAQKYHLNVSTAQTEHVFQTIILKEFWLFWQEWNPERCERLRKLVGFANMAGFSDWHYRMENQVFMSLVEKVYPRLKGAEGGEQELLRSVMSLAELLNINVEASLKVYESTRVAPV